MLAVVDWFGISACISAFTAGVAAILSALNHRTVSNIDRKTDTNGDPRSLGQIASDVAKEVAPPDTPPAPAP
jgi:hypothetical protein